MGCQLGTLVSFYRRVLVPFPAAHPDRYLFLYRISRVLSHQYDRAGHWRLTNMEEEILLAREAVKLWPSHYPYRASPLIILTLCDLTTCQLTKVEEAILPTRDILPSHHPYQASSLITLACPL